MDEAAIAIIHIRVERADGELRATRKLIEDGLYRIACTRAYYAAFLMTTAVLLTLDVARTKHSGVEAAFHEQFIRGARIEAEYGRLYALLRKTREDSDYNESDSHRGHGSSASGRRRAFCRPAGAVLARSESSRVIPSFAAD